MNAYIIKGATLVNRGQSQVLDVMVKGDRIERIDTHITTPTGYDEIRAEGLHLIPGIIDDQVHFREPGLTYKADIASESKAAVAGGVTSFMEMPNTVPNALTQELLEDKYHIAQHTSYANFSFFMGVGNSNVEEVLKTNAKKQEVCGVKIFMGSSTGDMLVDNYNTLEKIFSETELLIATHCEKESIIAANKLKYAHADSAAFHPLIRDVAACYESSLAAIQLAQKFDSRLHILHISTAKELQLFGNMMPLKDKRITAEVCVHHLHFTADDYDHLGNLIKCNPAIKAADNKPLLWAALLDDLLDVIATDHAPHTWEEKGLPYMQAPSGLPLVQHALQLMWHYVQAGTLSVEQLVHKMCHAPAVCFQMADRGFLDEGYYADMVLVNTQKPQILTRDNSFYKCHWTPLEGFNAPVSIESTFVNGTLVYEKGQHTGLKNSQRLQFNRP